MTQIREAFKALFARPEVTAQELASAVRLLLPKLNLDPQAIAKAERGLQYLTKEVPVPAWGSGASATRGLFVVFEGLDRSGKSTQSKELLAGLERQKVPCKWTCFPMRQTALGGLIDLYLRRQLEMPDAVVHMLFSANRWEQAEELVRDLNAGITVVCDRYAFSGVVYTAAKGLDPAWCRLPDVGVPRPDLVFFLHVDPKVGAGRASFGDERYENPTMQQNVREQFQQADFGRDVAWHAVDGAREKEVISKEIWEKVEDFRAGYRENKMPPIANLWATTTAAAPSA